jgi:hypothetical protein
VAGATAPLATVPEAIGALALDALVVGTGVVDETVFVLGALYVAVAISVSIPISVGVGVAISVGIAIPVAVSIPVAIAIPITICICVTVHGAVTCTPTATVIEADLSPVASTCSGARDRLPRSAHRLPWIATGN